MNRRKTVMSFSSRVSSKWCSKNQHPVQRMLQAEVKEYSEARMLFE
jgi:hypothetical protein